MALGRLSVEEQFEAQCDAHGRSATRMGAVRRPWAQCDAHGRSATRMGAVRRRWARSDFSNLPSPLSPAHVQIVDARAARSPTTSPPLWTILRAAHAVAQPRHLPSDTLPRHLPSDALPRHHVTSPLTPCHVASPLTPCHVTSPLMPCHVTSSLTPCHVTSPLRQANAFALCLMYGRDLATAVLVLEDQLQASPLTAVDETVVLNLCSMYELAVSDTLNAKSTLSNWLAHLAPDDFDFACTRL
ncbi:unnamed protein product [Closterium sp. NIES-65]|nr:unnamed protein product [Closterium sp. NIES-65]